jgi:hypothetical protein
MLFLSFFVIVSLSSVRLQEMRNVVRRNVAYLESEGFSRKQLYHGLELLFYPQHYIAGGVLWYLLSVYKLQLLNLS